MAHPVLPVGREVPAHRQAVLAGTASVLLLIVAGAGPSAASPALGPGSALPPFDLGLRLSSVWVTVDLVAAYLLAAVAVTVGLRAVSVGWRPRPRGVAVAAVAVVGALMLVAPFGSADHLSYAAYGRIATQGGDPYLLPADRWRHGLDPVAQAVEPPWRHTASVYGPVATALQAATSLVGGTSVRATVWASQLLVGVCFLLTGWLLDRMVRDDPFRRARVAVVWTLNPLLLGTVVGGDHLDGVCAAAATGCLFLGLRTLRDGGRLATSGRAAALAAATGACWAVAAGTKVPYAAVGLALLWGMRGVRARMLIRTVGAATLGAAIVLVPSYLWAGPHVLDQYRRASHYVSLASPWAVPMSAVERLLGLGVRAFIPLAVAPVGLVVLAAVWQAVHRSLPAVAPGAHWTSPGAEDTVRALLALSAAYLISAPYVLPWYDAIAWPALAVAGTTALDGALTMRLTALAIAYVPGRVEGVSPAVAALMLDVRSFVAPVVTTGVLLWVLVTGARRWRGRDPGRGRDEGQTTPPHGAVMRNKFDGGRRLAAKPATVPLLVLSVLVWLTVTVLRSGDVAPPPVYAEFVDPSSSSYLDVELDRSRTGFGAFSAYLPGQGRVWAPRSVRMTRGADRGLRLHYAGHGYRAPLVPPSSSGTEQQPPPTPRPQVVLLRMAGRVDPARHTASVDLWVDGHRHHLTSTGEPRGAEALSGDFLAALSTHNWRRLYTIEDHYMQNGTKLDDFLTAMRVDRAASRISSATATGPTSRSTTKAGVSYARTPIRLTYRSGTGTTALTAMLVLVVDEGAWKVLSLDGGVADALPRS